MDAVIMWFAIGVYVGISGDGGFGVQRDLSPAFQSKEVCETMLEAQRAAAIASDRVAAYGFSGCIELKVEPKGAPKPPPEVPKVDCEGVPNIFGGVKCSSKT
jgi:hypothetical protein